jgi:general secretion pathway protein G
MFVDGKHTAAPVQRRKGERGLTLVELIVAFTILALLCGMAVPLARYRVRRDRERELRWALHQMREAIDKYKDLCDQNKLGSVKLGTECYPESLDMLVEGVKISGKVDTKMRFLRRIPKDPTTNTFEWGKRSMQDDPKSNSWGGQNVFDVFSKSTLKGSDGTQYTEW